MTTEGLLNRLSTHPDTAVAAEAATLLNRYRRLIQRKEYVKAHWIHKQAWSLYDTAASTQSVHTSSHGLDEQL